jgi:hypothetical protein
MKLVSFGGGKMEGMLTLRATLEEGWRQKTGQRAKVKIVDFSLSKALVTAGGMKEEDRDSSVWKDVILHIGPIEIRDLSDADEADVMVSMFGPFYHAERGHVTQLLAKAVAHLKINGKAFFHIPYIKDGQRESVQKRFTRAFGKNFRIKLSNPPIEGVYVHDIELLEFERTD